MRFIHLSDLHLGKQVCEMPLLDDQKYILDQIIGIAGERAVDAVVLAGDIYDKTVPPAEAVTVLDRFMRKLSAMGIPLLMVAGNHDSGERLSFGSSLLENGGVYLTGMVAEGIKKVTLGNEGDETDFYLMPFIRPGNVRQLLPEKEIRSYDDAVAALMETLTLSETRPSVIVAHQFVTAEGISPERSDSELLSLGGTDNVDVSHFDGFCYVALGHIHRPQRLMRESVRYAGSPLKYSFSEARHEKSVVLVTVDGMQEPAIELIPLQPLHDLREIRGPIDVLLSETVVSSADRADYLHITLTDPDPVPDALHRLRQVYPNIMRLDFARKDAGETIGELTAGELEKRTPLSLFHDFYETMQGECPGEEETALIRSLMAEVWSGEQMEEEG